jgi:peptidoglycan hydrolase-like protein with peptidoglycan-binding domain
MNMRKKVVALLLLVVLMMTTAAVPVFADDRHYVHFHGKGDLQGYWSDNIAYRFDVNELRVGPSYYNKPGIRYVENHFTVALVQDLLWQFKLHNLISQSGGSYDGIYGAQTIAGIKDFQRANGLYADGIVGPDTWRAMEQKYKAIGTPTLWFYAYGGSANPYKD